MSIARLMQMAAAGNGGPSDPFFDQTTLLLHGDGTNGSTTFVDSSSNNFTITTNGNAQIDTAVKKYGTGSMEFDGDRDFLSAPSSTDFAFGTGDFTIEHWVYGGSQPEPYPRTVVIGPTYATNSVGTNFDDEDNPGKFAFYARNLLNGRIVVSSSNVNDSAWHHVAITRASGVFRLFIDGVLEATNSSYIGSSVGTTAQPLTVGGVSSEISGEDFLGYIDDLRITKGVARYTAAFTPPDKAFPNQ